MKILFLRRQVNSRRFIFNEKGSDLNGFSHKENKEKFDFKTDIRMVDVKNKVLSFFLDACLQRQFAMLEELKESNNNSTIKHVLKIIQELMPEYVENIDEICLYLRKELSPSVTSPAKQAIHILQKF